MQWYEQHNIYEDAEEFLDADEISAAEEGFMRGYQRTATI